jgi:hypothetical protein
VTLGQVSLESSVFHAKHSTECFTHITLRELVDSVIVHSGSLHNKEKVRPSLSYAYVTSFLKFMIVSDEVMNNICL